jgi:hypothetical protein
MSAPSDSSSTVETSDLDARRFFVDIATAVLAPVCRIVRASLSLAGRLIGILRTALCAYFVTVSLICVPVLLVTGHPVWAACMSGVVVVHGFFVIDAWNSWRQTRAASTRDDAELEASRHRHRTIPAPVQRALSGQTARRLPSDPGNQTPERNYASEYVVLSAPPPVDVQNALRTIDEVDRQTDVTLTEGDCRTRLVALAHAAGEGRLLLQGRLNSLTRTVGLVVCESWHAGVPSGLSLVAELLESRAADWAAQTQRMEQLVYLAAHGALSIVAHGPSERRAVFVGRVWRADGALDVEYLARLLITDEEIAQWRR